MSAIKRYSKHMKTGLPLWYTVLLLLVAVGCKKDPQPEPVDPTMAATASFDITQKDWVVHSARVYLFNMDNGQQEYYDHFDSTKSVSNLDLINGSALPIDTIEKNVTKWHFDDNGLFTLNDTLQYNYWLYNGTYSIIGLENGSARPLVIRSFGDDHFTTEVYEAYQSDGTYNYNYYSVVTFLRQGATCSNCVPAPDAGFTYQGTISPTPAAVNDLIGTSWVITRYDQGVTPYYPNDTLDFTDFNSYTINGGAERNYSYSGIVGNNMKSLDLYDFTTLGGNYSGQVLSTFVDDWEFNNATFSAILGPPGTVQMWGTRIN